MNYPLEAIITGLRSAIITKIPGRNVLTVPAKDTEYPYVYLSQPYMYENGPKSSFIYEVEMLLQVIHKDLTSIKPLLDDMQKIHEIIKNGADITVAQYKVLAVELINSTQTVELLESGRLDIGLIRINIIVE
jgi:hypothetical protein